MSLNTYLAVTLAQLDQADIPHVAAQGLLGQAVEIETPTGQWVLLGFDKDGDLLFVEIEGETHAD